MAHKQNLNYLHQLKKKLGDDPAAGKIATIINEYASLLDSRIEHKYLELGKSYRFALLNGEPLLAKILEIGTYTIWAHSYDEDQPVMIFKSAIAYASPIVVETAVSQE